MMRPEQQDVVLLKDGRELTVVYAAAGYDSVMVEDVDAEMRGEDYDNCIFSAELKDIEKITWFFAEHHPEAAAELRLSQREYKELEKEREKNKS